MCPRRGTPSVYGRRHREEPGADVRRGATRCVEDARRRQCGTSPCGERELERFEEVVRWLRSYEVEEIDGAIGSICLYEAVNPEAIRHHSAAAALPVDEILKVADMVVVRPDPAAAAA